MLVRVGCGVMPERLTPCRALSRSSPYNPGPTADPTIAHPVPPASAGAARDHTIQTKRPLPQLQIVRAIAALIVVVFHAQGELGRRGFTDPLPRLTVGAFGVDLFFVVSGFIMVFATNPLFGRPGKALPFMARRIIRIAPLYWLFTALFVGITVVLAFIPGHRPPSPSHVVASFLFLPAARPEDGAYLPAFSPGWTLNYEMFFYVCFALAIGLRRGPAVLTVSAGLILLVATGRLTDLPWPMFYWADPITLEFVFGMWIALAHIAGRRLPPRFGIALSLAAAGGVVAYAPFIDTLAAWRGIAWGVPAAVIVGSAIGSGGHPGGPVSRALVRLGDASYSLYLVHSALFLAVFAGLSRVVDPHRIPPWAYGTLLVAGSAAAAAVLFRLVEAPITRGLQRALGRRAAPTSTG